MSDGGHVDGRDGGGDGGGEGGWEPIFRRFLYDMFFRMVLFFGIICFSYQDPSWVSTREVVCGPRRTTCPDGSGLSCQIRPILVRFR